MALKYKGNVKELHTSKIAIAKKLLQSGLEKNKARRLLNFIKLYINFEPVLTTKFDKHRGLLPVKRKRNMGITELILDIAEKRGLEKGENAASSVVSRKVK